MTKNNETKLLTKIVLMLTIMGFIIAPWLYHDRAIGNMRKDIEYIKLKVDAIEKAVVPRIVDGTS